MSALPQLDLLRLEALVHDYRLGELIRYWPAAAGIENSNYFLATRKAGVQREYVLTLLEQPANAGGALVPLLDVCVAAGLPVPPVLRNGAGKAFSDVDGKPAMVCSRLPGRHVSNPTLKQVEALGRFLGHFHYATSGSSGAELDLPVYPRNLGWLRDNSERCRGQLGYRAQALLRDTRRQLGHALARGDVARLPQGPIHGDLFRDNVLFNEWGLAGVLDFHHAAHGYLIYDLAVAANDWCTEANGALDPERVLALLRAYHAIRPLTRQELWFFPVFALYGALAFWTSRLVVDVARRRGSPLRGNNPEEFQRILEHHQGHFFYLDERRLLDGAYPA